MNEIKMSWKFEITGYEYHERTNSCWIHYENDGIKEGIISELQNGKFVHIDIAIESELSELVMGKFNKHMRLLLLVKVED